MIHIEFTDQRSRHTVDGRRLTAAAESVLLREGVEAGEVSIAVVDDATIHELNRRYLDHDWATDVLSFVLQQDDRRLEGEVIVSADTAARVAADYRWSADDELLLYVIHGVLHLVGYDDGTPAARAEMRERERLYLADYQLEPHYDEARAEAAVGSPARPVRGQAKGDDSR